MRRIIGAKIPNNVRIEIINVSATIDENRILLTAS